jgi:hypothetical protein
MKGSHAPRATMDDVPVEGLNGWAWEEIVWAGDCVSQAALRTQCLLLGGASA